MIDNLTIQRIKDASNVVDVIGDFYSLKRNGAGMTCLCPFHQDRKLGSFKISEAKNMFTCYSCSAHGNAVDFLMMHEHFDFIEAIKWLGAKYGIEVEDSEKWKDKVKQCKPHAPTPPLPMLTLPYDYVLAKKVGMPDNTLVRWIMKLPWNAEQARRVPLVLNNYQVGHSQKSGHTIFWQIDENGDVRTGKMMLYKPDGHRDKESSYNFDYIHSALFRAHKLDPMNAEAKTCYFGQHLLKVCPKAKINIVESEKTALICAIAFGSMLDNLWMATGGLNFLNKEKLEPFIKAKRKIVLWPDHDGIEKWTAIAAETGYKRMYVNTTYVKTLWEPEDGEKADVADVIIRMLGKTEETILDKMCKTNDDINYLREKFNLELIKK